MKKKRGLPGLFPYAALFALLLLPVLSFQKGLSAGQAGFEDRMKELLVGKELYLRERVNSSPKVYCTITDSSETFFIQDEGRLLNLGKKAKVKITGVKHYRSGKRLKVKFKHEKLGKGSINFYWTRKAMPGEQSFKEMARLAFCETEEDDDIILFVGNRQSRKLHFIGCNHLPEASLQERFLKKEEAINQGYSMCEMCFRRNMLLRDQDLENHLASLVTSQLLSTHTVYADYSINARVRRLGEKVLNNWPTPLRGYKYSFTVLASRRVNACAAPGGKIYVNYGLIEATESENELIGILAHEIAHVERRHGVREYYKKKSRALLTELAARGLKWGVGSVGADPMLTSLIYNSFIELSVLANMIALAGYSRELEIEADYYAIAFLNYMGDNTSYAGILRKLQYDSNVRGYVREKTTPFDSHPKINQRVQFADNARVRVYPANSIFVGYSREGEEVAEIRFEAQCVSHGEVPLPREPVKISNFRKEGYRKYENVKRLKLFATVSATEELGEICEIKEIKVRTGGTVHKLDNKEDTHLFPMHEIGCTFENDSDKLLGRIDGIELNLRNVDHWERR